MTGDDQKRLAEKYERERHELWKRSGAKPSLLAHGLTDEQWAERQQQGAEEDLDWQRYRILLEVASEHYVAVSTKPDLDVLTRMVVQISEDFEGERLERIPDRGRHRLIGEMIERAVLHDRDRESGTAPVNNKQVFKGLVRDLIDEAHRRGHVKTLRDGDERREATKKGLSLTAYEFVSDLLAGYGITNNGKPYAPSTLANWK